LDTLVAFGHIVTGRSIEKPSRQAVGVHNRTGLAKWREMAQSRLAANQTLAERMMLRKALGPKQRVEEERLSFCGPNSPDICLSQKADRFALHAENVVYKVRVGVE
jgi:hypothetical protein